MDRLRGQQEIVIKALDPAVSGAAFGIAGATIMGDGSVVLILDTLALFEERRGQRGGLPLRGGGLAMFEAHFGLREKPFRKTPDPRYLFLNEAYEEALEQLLYAVEERDLALLTGEVGSGKTLLSRALVDRLGDRYEVGMILNPRLSPRQFLRTVASEIGIAEPRFHAADLLQQIHDRLLELDEAGRPALLIVDEAHLIPGKATFEEIRLLTNFQLDDRNLIALVLIGQPELRERLQHRSYRALTQRIGAQFHLVPLAEEDTAAYLRHRAEGGGSGAGALHRRAPSGSSTAPPGACRACSTTWPPSPSSRGSGARRPWWTKRSPPPPPRASSSPASPRRRRARGRVTDHGQDGRGAQAGEEEAGGGDVGAAPEAREDAGPREDAGAARSAGTEDRATEAAAPETELVFPEDPAPAPSGRIELPASGTAEEILARAEARGPRRGARPKTR